MKKKHSWFLAGLVLAALLVTSGLVFCYALSRVRDADDADRGDDGQAPSADLQNDLRLMWETGPLKGTPDPTHGPNPRASTHRAVHAASRVFRTVILPGLT